MKLPHDFESFHEKLLLGKKQVDRINSAADRLTDYLIDKLDLSAEDVFLQGSYENETAIRPDPEADEGEYDVDLVAVCARSDASEDEAIEELEEVLEDDDDYDDRIERDDPKKPCVRLRYADDEIGRFHVDATPAREPADGEAPLEIPRRDSGWRETDPKAFTQWCADQGEEFARAVRMLKRWRDHNQDVREAVKSIVLQVLIAEHLPEKHSDAERIAGALRGTADYLADYEDEAPEVRNPVLEDEILTDRWQADDYRKFRDVVTRAAEMAEEALEEADVDRSRELWQELFGKDFPGAEKRGKYTPPGPPPQGRTRPQRAPDVEWG